MGIDLVVLTRFPMRHSQSLASRVVSMCQSGKDLVSAWYERNKYTRLTVHQKALYYYIGIVNILTDVALVIIPIFVVHDLQLKTQKKVFVVFLFATRIW